MDEAVDQGTRNWSGAPALEPFLIPIGDLRESEFNPNQGDVDEIMLSLKRFGQTRAVCVAKDGQTIIAGHHVTKAAKKLGWTHVACIPGDFANAEEEIAFLMADNELAKLSTTDADVFVQTVMGIGLGNLEGTGISIDRYDDMLAETRQMEIESAEMLEATYSQAEDEIAAAARAAAIEAYQQKREVVMLMTPEEYERWQKQLVILRQEYGTEGVKDTVLKAVATEAYRLNQGEAEAAEEPPRDEAPAE